MSKPKTEHKTKAANKSSVAVEQLTEQPSKTKVGGQTKAGPKSKRSVRALKQAKAKVDIKPKAPKLPHSKRFRELQQQVDTNKVYALEAAVKLAKQTANTKFDATCELHIKLGQEGRGVVKFPHSTGHKIRVATVDDQTLEAISQGKIDFDVLIATPDKMPQLAKFAKTLGPKGLMPNPKSGTVTSDPDKVKQEIESGRFEYRTDEGKNVHFSVGKISQQKTEIITNINEAMKALQPLGIKTVSLSSTMGPGIKVKIEV